MRDTNLLRLAPPWTVTSSGLHARVPRARCDKCGVKKISVPWARDGGGLTLLFEALVRALVSAMSGNAVARLVGEHDTRLRRVIGSTACPQGPEGPCGLRGCLPPLQKSTQLGTTRAARNLAYPSDSVQSQQTWQTSL